jgi:DNA processing protein
VASIELRPEDAGYPPALSALAGGAPTLYVRGRLPSAPAVAIVGTREPSDEARAFARALAGDLARDGIVVFSGGARGVDLAAHEGALDAGGATVVVMGGGLARPYPPEHEPLFARAVAHGGALVARVPDDVPPQPVGFLRRNEILAALTQATVVVEAGVRSGARSTAAAARKLGRPLLVVPHAPWSPHGAGCIAELACGAIVASSAADVLAALGAPARKSRSTAPPFREARRRHKKEGSRREPSQIALAIDLSDDERAVLGAFGEQAARASERAFHLDELAERTSLPSRTVQGALLTLTLKAVVVEGPAGFFRRVRCS